LGKKAAEKDGIVKAKLSKKIRALEGAMKAEKVKVKKAKVDMKKESQKQKKEIADVVKGVVLSKDGGVNKAQTEANVAAAKKAKARL